MYFPHILATLPVVDVRPATGLYVTQPDTEARMQPSTQTKLITAQLGGLPQVRNTYVIVQSQQETTMAVLMPTLLEHGA